MSLPCPNCNRLNAAEVNFCVNCGYNLSQASAPTTNNTTCRNCNYPLAPGQAHCPQCGSRSTEIKDDRVTDTLGSVHRKNSTRALLKAVSLNQIAGRDVTLDKSETIINREMIDESDRSISISQHCKITNKDGRWFLENLSSNGAVFIQVGKKVELDDDTIILIGNTKFYVFHSD